jgi:hypothetical protein
MIVDGRTVYFCSTLAIEVQGKQIRTVDGLAVGGGEKGYQFGGRDGARCGVTLWPGVGAGKGEERLLPLSGRIVFGFDQWGAVSLPFDLEDDRLFDQAVEKSHRQWAINQILSPFVEVHIGHQRGGALLVA